MSCPRNLLAVFVRDPCLKAMKLCYEHRLHVFVEYSSIWYTFRDGAAGKSHADEDSCAKRANCL